MSTQLKDGSWTETEGLVDALNTFASHLGIGDARKLVVGTREEVEEEKEKGAVQDQLDELQGRMKALESKEQTDVVVPTSEEVKCFGGEVRA